MMKKSFKATKVISVVCAMAVMLMIAVGCTEKPEDNNQNEGSQTNSEASNDSQTASQTNSKPVKGQQIATISIKDFGDVKIMLFPEQAPKTVENFTTHANDGYYDGLTFHRVIADFMVQGGDPQGTGIGGESIWGEPFEDEFSKDLHNFTGALSMANSGPGTNGSQFFIVNTPPIVDVETSQGKATADQILEMNGREGLTEKAKDMYKKVGGTPWLDDMHTVFGQVYDGMDVIKEVMAADTNSNDAPLNPVVIETIKISVAE